MSTHVAIVGAYGSAGVAVAERLADDPEVELTLIDDGDPGGGLCILRGCMPSKEVLSAAEHRFAARHDDRLSGPLPDVDLEAVVARKDDHTSNFAAHRRAAVDRLAEPLGNVGPQALTQMREALADLLDLLHELEGSAPTSERDRLRPSLRPSLRSA
jgi:hypothetical protein